MEACYLAYIGGVLYALFLSEGIETWQDGAVVLLQVAGPGSGRVFSGRSKTGACVFAVHIETDRLGGSEMCNDWRCLRAVRKQGYPAETRMGSLAAEIAAAAHADAAAASPQRFRLLRL